MWGRLSIIRLGRIGTVHPTLIVDTVLQVEHVAELVAHDHTAPPKHLPCGESSGHACRMQANHSTAMAPRTAGTLGNSLPVEAWVVPCKTEDAGTALEFSPTEEEVVA